MLKWWAASATYNFTGMNILAHVLLNSFYCIFQSFNAGIANAISSLICQEIFLMELLHLPQTILSISLTYYLV